MFLTIITINRNNSEGLEKTLRSVLSQSNSAFEYLVIDGASTDGSVQSIIKYAKLFNDRLIWVSEPDDGIYNAMNKGISLAKGDYVLFLNSGDCLAAKDVVASMHQALEETNYPSIVYGNMLKVMPNGIILKDRCFAGQDITFLGFYSGTLNHPPTLIKRDLFVKYGLYDESLKIVSDWKWFLQAIILGEEKPIYRDIDVTVFDMSGISETNKALNRAERERVLAELINSSFLADYDRWAFPIEQIKRLQRHPWAYKAVWFIERCLFKVEKWQQRLKKETQYQ